MRKILLSTTAVVSAALGAAVITPAAAQDAPTVRLGGSIQAYYGYIQQSGNESAPGGSADFGRVANTTANFVAGAGGTSSIAGSGRGGYTGVSGTTNNNTPTGMSAGPGNGIAQGAAAPGNFARLGHHDILTLPAISVIVSGKSAMGFTYGGQIDLTFNTLEGNGIVGNRSSIQRSTASVDEAYIFLAHPRFGQLRAGDEDGVMGGLMNSGFVTGFGTGGVMGVWENFVTRQVGGRTQTAPGGLGDNSKVIYMSPQFFGFDFGVSFAPNGGGMGGNGCGSDSATGGCDRAYAYRGATSNSINPAQGGGAYARRNEYQIAARYRATVAGVGVAATAGYIGSGVALDMSNSGAAVRTLNGLNIWQVGAQASYLGFTVGANYMRGDYNFFWGSTVRGDRPGESINLGASYTAGPITVGANYTNNLVEGGTRSDFDPIAGRLVRQGQPQNANDRNNLAMQRRWGLGIGANYRLAPGLDLIAEYVYHSVREQGRDLDGFRPGVQSRAESNVFILGSRLAF